MFIEFIALGAGVPVMLACVSARMVAASGRSGDAAPEGGPVLGVVTQEALDDLPLVAPDRAGYGTASRMLVKTAAAHRIVPSSPHAPDHRKAA